MKKNIKHGIVSSILTSAICLFAVTSFGQTTGTVTGWGACCGYDVGQVTPPAGVSNVVAIAAGSYFNLALTSGGTVVGWGANGSGQINIPTGLSNVVAIAAGELHSLALTATGTVIGWGANGSGQTNIPSGLSNVVAIAAFGEQSLALTASGSVVSWGDNSAGQQNIPIGLTNAVAISAGYYFNLALTANGKVVAWGSNADGQTNVPIGLTNVISIAAGSSSPGNGQSWGLALTSRGQVVGWGGNNFGQISLPTGLSNVEAIATGWYHSMALKADGTVVAWGAGGDASFGQTAVPAGLSNVVAIAGGNVHSIALIGSGTNQPITITGQPQSVTTQAGSTVSFNVAATGNSTLSYQWFANGMPLIGGTNSTLTIFNAQPANNGNYSVVVSGQYARKIVGFASLFVNQIHAATASPIIAYNFFVGATISDSGYGYTNIPSIRIIGGGGSGAQAVAVVSNGVVVAINVINAGSGYTSAPALIIEPPYIVSPVLSIAPMSFLSFSNLALGGNYQLQQWASWYWTNQPVNFTASNDSYTQMVSGVAGSGSYRLALNPVPTQAFATPVIYYGFLVHATITSGGSGYATSPAISIVGGGGTNATATAQISGGMVTNILITSPGTGFTGTPLIKIAAPPAAAVAPLVLPVMRLDSSLLAPLHNYQVQFMPALGGTWVNWSNGLFSPTDGTNSQYLFITNDLGFFRLQYLP